jgi:uncharacterized protein (DUF58 family)
MAKPKELVVIVIDCGHTMRLNSNLQSAVSASLDVVHQKILFTKEDEVGIVLFGCKGEGGA